MWVQNPCTKIYLKGTSSRKKQLRESEVKLVSNSNIAASVLGSNKEQGVIESFLGSGVPDRRQLANQTFPCTNRGRDQGTLVPLSPAGVPRDRRPTVPPMISSAIQNWEMSDSMVLFSWSIVISS